MTVYIDQFSRGRVQDLMKEHPKTLFIFLAHESRGEPSTAAAQLMKRFAKVIIHVEGLQATVGGRCPGGNIIINDEKADEFGIHFKK